MNSSKKIMNQQEQEGKNIKKSSASVPEKKLKKKSFFGGRDLKPIILAALCVIVILVLCIGVGIQQFKPKVVITIGKTQITMDDMIYPIYEVESEYLPYNEMYESYYGTSIWEADYQGEDMSGAGISNSIGLKQRVLNSEVEYAILYKMAVKENYKLTADEKKDAKKDAKEALKGLSWLQKMRLNVSQKNLTERFEKRALAERYRDDRQAELNKTVDEAAAIKDISKKDYRQYDVQFYYGSLNETDENGASTPVSDEKKKELASKIKNIAKQAKSAKDFTKLISDKEEDITFEEEGSFTQQEGWSYVSESNLKKVKKMKNGEISEAFLDEDAGYYVVVKMVNNNSSEAYDTACDDAIADAQDQVYQTWFDQEAEKTKYKVNTDVWTDVTLGTVTTDIVTAEDLEKMNEDSDENNGSAE